jgi:hypothetical protein
MNADSTTFKILSSKSSFEDKVYRIYLAVEWSGKSNELVEKFYYFCDYLYYCEHEGFHAELMILELNKKAQRLDNEFFINEIIDSKAGSYFQEFEKNKVNIFQNICTYINQNIIFFP